MIGRCLRDKRFDASNRYNMTRFQRLLPLPRAAAAEPSHWRRVTPPASLM